MPPANIGILSTAALNFSGIISGERNSEKLPFLIFGGVLTPMKTGADGFENERARIQGKHIAFIAEAV